VRQVYRSAESGWCPSSKNIIYIFYCSARVGTQELVHAKASTLQLSHIPWAPNILRFATMSSGKAGFKSHNLNHVLVTIKISIFTCIFFFFVRGVFFSSSTESWKFKKKKNALLSAKDVSWRAANVRLHPL
jgi:hypothetical protein